MQIAKRQTEKDYYKDYMRLMFEPGENYENYNSVLKEYNEALDMKEELIDKLNNEITIIKSLKT